MSKEMLINFVPGEECRIAILEDGKLEEYYQERASAESHVSNIYKGRVTNTEPSIQAAFIDFGLERNGFLHTSDLHPKYFPGKDREAFEKVGKKTARRDRPPIQRCLKRGDEILVQVLKEGIGTKGPTLTSYLSIPGRFLVMMPDMKQLGVTRKVEDDDERKKSKAILKELNPPEEFGFIVRTAGVGQTKTDLKRDMSYLLRLWKNIETNRKKIRKVGELYAESDLVIRTIRDVFTNDIDRVIVDDLSAARRAADFLRVASPRTKTQVVFYDDPVPLFHRKGVETQIELITAREVPLPSGGALVIDSTEALVAIDVNSGKSRGARDAESNALNTNLEAVDEICRQLRLRDLGGIVVNDLIDMRPAGNRRKVESRMRDNLKKDRAKTRVGPISTFGLLEMTRQRMRASLKKSTHSECRQCEGLGHTLSAETVVLAVMRRLALVMQRQDVARVELTISPDVAFQLLNRKRAELTHVEEKYGKAVLVRVGGGRIDYVNIAAYDKRNQELDTDDKQSLKKLRPPSDITYRDLDDPDLPETVSTVVSDTENFEEEFEAAQDADDSSAGDGSESSTEDASKDARDDSGDRSDSDGPKKKRRRRRRGRKNRDDAEGEGDNDSATPEASDSPGNASDSEQRDASTGDGDPDDEDRPKKKRRRRRRGGRGRRKRLERHEDETDEEFAQRQQAEADAEASRERERGEDNPGESDNAQADDDRASEQDVSRDTESVGTDDGAAEGVSEGEPEGDNPPKKKRRRRSRKRKPATEDSEAAEAQALSDSSKDQANASEDNSDDAPVDADQPAEDEVVTAAAEAQDTNDQLSTPAAEPVEKEAQKPSMRKKIRKRNAPPPPGSAGYSNSVIPRRD